VVHRWIGSGVSVQLKAKGKEPTLAFEGPATRQLKMRSAQPIRTSSGGEDAVHRSTPTSKRLTSGGTSFREARRRSLVVPMKVRTASHLAGIRCFHPDGDKSGGRVGESAHSGRSPAGQIPAFGYSSVKTTRPDCAELLTGQDLRLPECPPFKSDSRKRGNTRSPERVPPWRPGSNSKVVDI
jgi:hypothetical protein